MARKFIVTCEINEDTEWPDGTPGVLEYIEGKEQSEVESIIIELSLAGKLQILEVEEV